MFHEARPDAKLRSLTGTYNCMGMVFASRRTCIDFDQLATILKEDGYYRVKDTNELLPGDIVLYGDPRGKPLHISVILEIATDVVAAEHRFKVLSKWGANGEYFHSIGDVPPLLGTPNEFYTERKLP